MASYTLTNASELFKVKYGKLSENVYNSFTPVLGRIKKSYNFVGKRMDVAVPTGFSGGVGSGSLPTANYAQTEDGQISAKKLYSVIQIDREATKAASTDEGAFVNLTKYSVQKGVESWMRNHSRILFNTFNNGILGLGDGTGTGVSGAGSTASPYVLTFPVSGWKEANWEERDFVNVVVSGTAETTALEVVSVVPATRAVHLVGTSSRLGTLAGGTTALAATDQIAMQNSYLTDPTGIATVCDATSSTLYAITVGRRWQAFQKAAGGAGLSVDLMNEVMLGVEKQSGKIPNLIVMGYTQYRKFLNLLEDHKRYPIQPRMDRLVGKVSFSAIEFASSAGTVPVIIDRFVDDDRVYFLNDNFIETYHRPGHGWFSDDGTIFLRSQTEDAYNARYGGYLENYIIPSFQGVMTGLAT
jgi:hypothetical protein